MEREEILAKASKKTQVGEMEVQKLNKANWISVSVGAVVAAIFCIAEGCLGHVSAVFAILAIMAAWACTFYSLQYFILRRHKGALIGAILEALAFVILVTAYILSNIYGW